MCARERECVCVFARAHTSKRRQMGRRITSSAFEAASMRALEAPTAAWACRSFEAGAATTVTLGPTSMSLVVATVCMAALMADGVDGAAVLISLARGGGASVSVGSCYPDRESEFLHQRRREREGERKRERERGRGGERERERDRQTD